MPNSLKCRLKKFVHKGLLSEKDLLRLYTDNDVIEELENIKTEIQGLIDFEESCCGNTTLGYECLGVIDNHISELKENEE